MCDGSDCGEDAINLVAKNEQNDADKAARWLSLRLLGDNEYECNS